ncbi:MAG: serine hydrolase [Bacteroidota bacterium]
MKRIVLFVASVVMCLNTGCSQEVAEAKSLLVAEINNKEIADLISSNIALFPNNTQLSIALIDGDQTTFIGVKRDRDELITTRNKNSVFEIGSISKVFTSILLSNQVNAHQLDLDDKVQSFMTFSEEKASEDSKEMTLRMLANHTSGLPRIAQNMLPVMMQDQTNPYKNYTPELLKEFFMGEIILENAPNTAYSYSNLGTGTLGYILTQNTGKTYEKLLQEDIFGPLGMGSSSSLLTMIDASKLVKGLDPAGAETSNWDFTDAAVGAGGIKSTAVDMEKFVRKNFEDDPMYVLPQKLTFTVNDNLHLGLGWHISIEDEKNYHWHNGGTGGYRSCMVLHKEDKKSVIVLSNVSAFGNKSENIDKLCFELMQTL